MTAGRINGTRIKFARELRGLDQADLAEQVGVTVPMIAYSEANFREFPRSKFERLLFVLKFPPKWFYLNDPEQFPLGSLAWHS